LKITRQGARFSVSFGPMVAIYPCAGARDPEMNATLQRGFMQWKCCREVVRTDAHLRDDTCWAHREGFCLSTAAP
jgi:protein-L-isoaspartate(D-aspartate) O-methyltransferase